MALLFALSAALQFNDPQPLAWIILYLLAAIAAGLITINKPPCAKILSGFVGVVAAIWEVRYLRLGAWKTPFSNLTEEWRMTNEQVVDGREFYALLWITVWMILVFLSAHYLQKRAVHAA